MNLKLPKKPAQLADFLYQITKQRIAMAKEVKKLEALETAAEQWFINNLKKDDATGIAGHVARVTVSSRRIPTVNDWPKFWKYIRKTGQFELLQKRIGREAAMERIDAKVRLPGVEVINAPTVSCVKVKGGAK